MSARWVREGRGQAARGEDEPEATRRLAPVLGQGDVLARWLRLARRLELPHAFLVDGPRGGGKTTVIEQFAAALLCPSELDRDRACGVCRTCTRIANGMHPDVLVLERARDQADKEYWGKVKSFFVITVHQVRAAQARLQQHASEGRARVLVIADADCLEEEGQNAMLKTLEEPGPATFLLLEATQPEKLAPTVHSRLQRLRVRPLDDATIRRELAARKPDCAQHHELAARLAHGSLGVALQACTEHAVQLHDLVQGMLREPDRLRPVATARAALGTKSERRVEVEAARMFLWVLRAELARRRDTLAAETASSYPAAGAEPWTTWLERTLVAERDLDLMIPPEQVLTACLASFASV